MQLFVIAPMGGCDCFGHQKVKASKYMPFAARKQTDFGVDYQATPDDLHTTVGSILRARRESRVESLDKTSRVLRISETYLDALEEDDRARMPELVYCIGFLKTYSLYLGLDAELMVHKFKQQFMQSIRAETLVFPAPAPERSIPTFTLVMIAGALALLIGIAWLYLKPTAEAIDEFQHLSPVVTTENEQDSVEAVSNPTETIEPVVQDSTPAGVLEDPKEYTQAYPIFPVPDARPYEATRAARILVNESGIYLGKGKSFIVLAKAESWVEIKNDKGQVLLSKTLKAGESQELPVSPNLTFSTGNAAGVSFYVDGKYYAGLGKEGEILRAKALHFSPAPKAE
jgi:cytoskeleton protein RodZ